MAVLFDQSSNNIKLGKWNFNAINLADSDLYAEYIKATEYPANLWSSNFAYLWAASHSSLRKVLWKIVDNLLVTFGYSFKNSLYLFCLPFGKANPEKLTQVVRKCLKYCYEWNNQENKRTLVRMINQNQLDFLRNYSTFNRLYHLVTLRGIERHLDIKQLVALSGKNFSTLRNKLNKFHRENPQAIIRNYQKSDVAALFKLQKDWTSIAGQKYANIFDKLYYREMVNHNDHLKQIILVVQNGAQIIGMVSGGELPTGQAWGSLLKYQDRIPGLSELLSVEFARELYRINPNIALLNVGSDLGPGGLRDYKLKFRPVLNLKRYQMYLK
jgi:hypothetical protein